MNSIETQPTQVEAALQALLEDLVRRSMQQHGHLPSSPWQEDWTSPCVQQEARSEELVYWQPVANPEKPDLRELEQGLEIQLHPDLKAFYGSLWADGLRVDSPWGEIGLIQVWNEQDLEYLKENLLGHAFMRKKRRLPLSFFIGIQRDDRIITLDNQSGCVMRETGGRRGDEKLCGSLVEFLNQLTPNLNPYHLFQG